MFYIQFLLILVWMLFTSLFGLVLCLVRWGNLDNNRTFARISTWGVLKITRIRVKLENEERLSSAQPCVFVANHQDNLDIITFGSLYPRRTVLIGKKEIGWIPIFNLFYIGAGNILIDRARRTKAMAGLSQAVDMLRRRRASIWIFPEGTRNRTGQGLLPFKKGAFHMAIEAGVPIVPIVCSPLKSVLCYHQKRFVPGEITIRVLEPVPVSGYNKSGRDIDKLAELVRGRMLEAVQTLSVAPVA